MSRVHARHFRTTASLAAVLTSGAVALAACGSASEQGHPDAAQAPQATATNAASTAPARSAQTTATAPPATTARAPVRAQPSHRAHKKHPRRAVVPSHLTLPPPPVHHLVTPLMPLRTHPMTSSEHLPPMPSPARLERPVG